MKTTHTLSSIEAAASALEYSSKVPNVSFSIVKPELTTHQTLEECPLTSLLRSRTN